jgi:hypothetical protein
MTKSFTEDVVYLGKIILLTLIVLSLVVIYNNKLMEGIFLISLCCQILLLWQLVEKYSLPKDYIIFFKKTESSSYKNDSWILISFILLIIALVFLFRALAIVQYSFNNYGQLKSGYLNDILFASGIGIMFLIIFIISTILGNKHFKKRTKLMINQSLF